jgi:3-carboxy-cis,cis-muconate cycloisomerase
MAPIRSSEIFSGLSGRGAVASEVDDRAWLRAMLDFEAALAAACAEAGLTPAPIAHEIAGACARDDYDLTALAAGTASAGTPVPALLAAMRAQLSSEAAGHLHRGATSQDVIDSAAMLVARRALTVLLEDVEAAADACALLADRHRDTLQPGRTLLQHALPVTFGLTAVGWLDGLDTAASQLAEVRASGLALQLGGAVGTLASLGDHGVAVAADTARRLELLEPALPWHSNRMRPALLAGALGASCGVAGKIATDVVLLTQTEVAELAPGGEEGGSSTLPHKRNPVAAVAARACAARAPGLVATMLAAMGGGEYQRAAGAWQAEPETLSELLRLTGSAFAAIRGLLEELRVDEAMMRENLKRTGGVWMGEAAVTALTDNLGRARAHELVEQASRRALSLDTELMQVLAGIPEVAAALDQAQLAEVLDPARYLGSAGRLIDRGLDAHRARRRGA